MKPTVRYWVEWYWTGIWRRDVWIGHQTSQKTAIREATRVADSRDWRIVKETISSEVVAESEKRKGKHDKAAT